MNWMTGLPLSLALTLTLSLATAASATEWTERWEQCAKGHYHLVAIPGTIDNTGGRNYAPDREIDIKHLKLELTPDFEKRSIAATARLEFSPIATPLTEFRLNAVNLNVIKVESSHPLKDHHNDGEHLTFLFQNPIPANELEVLTITYTAEPRDGLYFRTPSMGYPAGDDHFFTQGEPERHRNWFPSYDFPNERFTSEVICHVPSGMRVFSNGRLVSETPSPNGTVAFHWSQEQPHVNYLISVVGGYFQGVEDKLREIPLGFFTPPYGLPQAAASFADTKAILQYFEEETGIPYPWAKYYSVCVHGYQYGGMENTSVTTLTSRTLFDPAAETLRTTRHLDAHEAAHQWFGDLVTCKDWTHIWLNEGFATYYTELYEGHKFGRDHLLYGMYENAQQVLNTGDERPMAWREFKAPEDQFDFRAYPKGSWVLHMLRSQLGPDLYRLCVRKYLERHRGGVVVTEDLNRMIEEVSGRSFDRFFDQWVYHGGTPKLNVDYSWDPKRKQARLSVAQTQKVSEKVLLFQLPLPVRFHLKDGTRDFTIPVTQAREEFYFDLPDAPQVVRVDPDYTLLSEIQVNLPQELTVAQLALKDDMMGRLFAVRKLRNNQDLKTIDLLADRLKQDAFFGVRIEAAEALAERREPKIVEVLTANLNQPDARVRQKVVEALGRYYRPEARDTLLKVVKEEKNPEIVASALKAIGKFPEETIREALLAAMVRPSFRNTIAVAAIEGMEQQDRAEYVAPLLAHLKQRAGDFEDRGLGESFRALGRLGRDAERAQQDEVRAYLTGFLNDPRDTMIVPAIESLSALGDDRALAALQPLTELTGPRKREADAARKAVEALNADKRQGPELKDLRKEVLDMQAELRKLRQDLEGLRKQSEPVPPAPAPK